MTLMLSYWHEQEIKQQKFSRCHGPLKDVSIRAVDIIMIHKKLCTRMDKCI